MSGGGNDFCFLEGDAREGGGPSSDVMVMEGYTSGHSSLSYR